MPVLKEYTAKLGDGPISGGRRAEAGDFGADLSSVGPALKKVSNELQERVADDESRKAVVASAEIRAKYAKALDEAALSGAPLEPLKEQMRQDLGKVSEAFTTKKAADHMAVNIANADLMFDEQANRINVTRATAAAKVEGEKLIASLGSTIQSNPAYLPVAEDTIQAFAGTLTGVRPDQRATIVQGLTQQANMAAALAAARIDPEGTKKRLEAGEWKLDPEHRNTAVNMATTQQHARDAAAALQRAEAERNRKVLEEKSESDIQAAIMKGELSSKKLRDVLTTDPNLQSDSRNRLLAFAHARAQELKEGAQKSDPSTKRALWLAANAPPEDSGKLWNIAPILDAVKAGKLSTHDADALIRDVQGGKDAAGQRVNVKMRDMSVKFERAFAADPRSAMFDAQDKAAIANDYTARVREQFDEITNRKDGNKNPMEMFNPKSPDYVGSREFMQVSIDAVRNAKLKAATAGVPKVTTQAEFDALPSGAQYIGPNGMSRKPQNAKQIAAPKPEGKW